jgi:hypothetical protein
VIGSHEAVVAPQQPLVPVAGAQHALAASPPAAALLAAAPYFAFTVSRRLSCVVVPDIVSP